MANLLHFMGDNPVLTVILALILGLTVSTVCDSCHR